MSTFMIEWLKKQKELEAQCLAARQEKSNGVDFSDIIIDEDLRDDELYIILPPTDSDLDALSAWKPNTPSATLFGISPQDYQSVKAMWHGSLMVNLLEKDCTCPSLLNGHHNGCPMKGV